MNEPRSAQKMSPECPDWLEEEAQAEWNRLSETLFEKGILTDLDVATFAAYCQAYARWREAEEFISQHGSIVKNKNRILAAGPSSVDRTLQPEDYDAGSCRVWSYTFG